MQKGWPLLVLLLAGCTPLAQWLGKDLLPVPPDALVERLPPGYHPSAPRPPYGGPHPSRVPLDLSSFSLPVLPGETGPVDTSLGPLQYPFACGTEESGLGQPGVDNQDGIGTPVYAEAGGSKLKGIIAGYSRDCLTPTRMDYFYQPEGREDFLPLPAGPLPADMAWLSRDGGRIPFVLRVERGSLNRFLYAIAMLADPAEPVTATQSPYWNRRLIFHFRGGVGIGKRQGHMKMSTLTKRLSAQLAEGYAVLGTSANVTATQYNVWLAGNTAQLAKAQFVARYGRPDHTVGLGASGGAVQQYLLAETHPGLLDALIPQYSYPDMITQSIWALDCELLEYYFDVTARDNPRWRVQENRSLVLGLPASSRVESRERRYYRWARWAGLGLRLPPLPPGATECSHSWRGLAPLTNNPHYSHHAHRYVPEVAARARFSHWHDLAHVYGVDEDGFAHRTHDNTGVQYGLGALVAGELSLPEFLHLNAHVGSWKAPKDMVQERYWLLSGDTSLARVSIWSHHNMRQIRPVALRAFADNRVDEIRVAPRARGHREAMAAAYRAGQVFLGRVAIPIIDIRHYLDPELDMHHSFASLSSRLRLLRTRGQSDNMLIWQSLEPFDPTPAAFALLARWLAEGRRPADAEDACWDGEGRLIARGPEVWRGPWLGVSEPGPCLRAYPPNRSPRNVAGSPLAGDLFRCALIPVAQAMAEGIYGDVEVGSYRTMLEKIFPDGVCDYRRGDLARPSDAELGLAPVL